MRRLTYLSLRHGSLRIALCVALAWSGSCAVYDSGLLLGAGAAVGASGSGGLLASAGSGNEAGTLSDGGSAGRAGVAGSAGKIESGAGAGGTAGTAGAPEDAGAPSEGGAAGCTSAQCCPSGSLKASPGQCGCDSPDTDTDGDKTADCKDQCPKDPLKIAPQVCGCGVDEAAGLALVGALKHRYSFNGTGTQITDSKGTAHGTAIGVGTALTGSGQLSLSGGINPQSSDPKQQYVALPGGCLDGLSDATFEAWAAWISTGVSADQFQRLFDFGANSTVSSGTYIAFSMNSDGPSGISRTLFAGTTTAVRPAPEYTIAGPKISVGKRHFAIVVDHTHGAMTLYVDGAFIASKAFAGSLAEIDDQSCWLGRSHYTIASDPFFNGTLDEFRIYSAALSAAQVATSFSVGPDPKFL